MIFKIEHMQRTSQNFMFYEKVDICSFEYAVKSLRSIAEIIKAAEFFSAYYSLPPYSSLRRVGGTLYPLCSGARKNFSRNLYTPSEIFLKFETVNGGDYE